MSTVKLHAPVADLILEHLAEDNAGGSDQDKVVRATVCESGATAPGGAWLSRSMVVGMMSLAFEAGQRNPYCQEIEYEQDCE